MTTKCLPLIIITEEDFYLCVSWKVNKRQLGDEDALLMVCRILLLSGKNALFPPKTTSAIVRNNIKLTVKRWTLHTRNKRHICDIAEVA